MVEVDKESLEKMLLDINKQSKSKIEIGWALHHSNSSN